MKNQFHSFDPFNPEKQTTSNNNSQIKLSKLALFGNILAIVGEAIATYADFQALVELQQAQQNDPYEERIRKLENQIHYLNKELQKQKMRKKF